jgi:hypothetical protein
MGAYFLEQLPSDSFHNDPPPRNMVACACNPSYWGGRDQEDYHSKSVWAKS